MVFLLLWRRQIVTPRSQSCEGVLGLGGVAKGVLPSHSPGNRSVPAPLVPVVHAPPSHPGPLYRHLSSLVTVYSVVLDRRMEPTDHDGL
jgi:hypothetical protein